MKNYILNYLKKLPLKLRKKGAGLSVYSVPSVANKKDLKYINNVQVKKKIILSDYSELSAVNLIKNVLREIFNIYSMSFMSSMRESGK
jgi:hypothetical protein